MRRLLVIGVLIVAAVVGGVLVVDRVFFTPTIVGETSGGPPPYVWDGSFDPAGEVLATPNP